MTYTYFLSAEAKYDLDDIFDFGKFKFGYNQATKYLVGLESHFESIAQNPNIGKSRDEILLGLISFPYISHIIFYRIIGKRIRIVRVLYKGREYVKFLLP